MKYKILFLSARPPFDPSQAIADTKAFFTQRTLLDLDFEYRWIDQQFELKKFGIKDKAGNECYGVDGFRKLLGDLKIDFRQYNVVILGYNAEKSQWWKNKPGILCNWTHWETFMGAIMIEAGMAFQWGNSDLYRVLTHELIHSYHKACAYNGYATIDTMDLYDDEMEVLSATGNRARNLQSLAGKWDLVAIQTWAQYFFPQLQFTIKAIINKIMNPTSGKIGKWAEAIKQFEGWHLGSRSYRNCNPGNFKYSSVGYLPKYGTVGKDKEGFAIFPSYQIGFDYLCNNLRNIASGKSSVYNAAAFAKGLANAGEMNLKQFCEVYAPEKDQNDPIKYAAHISKTVGFGVGEPIKNML